MAHRITVSRLFELGQYKNLRIEAETTDITDEQWNNPIEMDFIRSNLAQECFLNFFLSQELAHDNADGIGQRAWSELYESLRADRHPEDYEIDVPAPEANTGNSDLEYD